MGEVEYEKLVASNPKAAMLLLMEKDREIEKLRRHLLNAAKARFGSKSEKLSSADQQELFRIDELVAPPEQEELPAVQVPAYKRSAPRKRRALPKNTVVKRIDYPPSETVCGCCGKALVEVRKEVTNILNFVPAHFVLEEHARPVMACSCCKESAPVTTPMKEGAQLIPRCPAGVGLLSHILISKYQDHLPLHRQEQMFARLGYELPRKRMCEWMGKVAEIGLALYKATKRELVLQRHLQADETTVKIQDGEERGKCHTGYFWALLGPPPVNLVYFHYADSRAGEVPRAILSDFKGVLQTDLYAGYNEVFVPERARRAGCWAHVRRKFLEIQKCAEQDVQKVLRLIARLYQVEPSSQDADVILAARKAKSSAIVAELHEHLTTWSARTLPSSDVQKPIQYALKQWEALSLFLAAPAIPLDNNLIENQMRPIALGRKNWLFAGSHEGAMRAAIFFTLINSCRLNKVNTWDYFNDVLPRVAATAPADLPALLPHRWKLRVKNGA